MESARDRLDKLIGEVPPRKPEEWEYIPFTSNENLTGSRKREEVGFDVITPDVEYGEFYRNLERIVYHRLDDRMTLHMGVSSYVLEGQNLRPIYRLLRRFGLASMMLFDPNKHHTPAEENATIITRITVKPETDFKPL